MNPPPAPSFGSTSTPSTPFGTNAGVSTNLFGFGKTPRVSSSLRSCSNMQVEQEQEENEENLTEGTVHFSSIKSTSYRYQFRVKENPSRLQIWLEDRKSKEQWQSIFLELKDFVQPDIAIPRATFQDYLTCFQNCLGTIEKSTDSSRLLVFLNQKDETKEEAIELQLTLHIKVHLTTWSPTYHFLLKKIPLDKIDMLEAKVRDQEEEICSLTKQIIDLKKDMMTSSKTFYIQGITEKNHTTGQTLVWKRTQPTDFGFNFGLPNSNCVEFLLSGKIQFNLPGPYLIQIIVQHNNTNNNVTLLLKNENKTLVSCTDSDSSGHWQTATIVHVFSALPTDQLSVVYQGNNQCAAAKSYLLIHSLFN